MCGCENGQGLNKLKCPGKAKAIVCCFSTPPLGLFPLNHQSSEFKICGGGKKKKERKIIRHRRKYIVRHELE